MENKKTAEARRPWYTKVVKSRKEIGERIVIFKIVDVEGVKAEIDEETAELVTG